MNPLANINGPGRGPCCPRCHATPCCCSNRPQNPLASVLCPRCQVNPCCCRFGNFSQSNWCSRCQAWPCRCPREAPPCVPCNPPFDDFATCPCGYQVGDILTLVGGTFVQPCTVTVTTINAETGSVTGVTITFAGSYSVFPTNPVATTGGQGRGCTLNITGTAGTAVTAVTVAAGGGPWPRGYRVGDVAQLEGGTFTAAASVVVTATNGGGQVTGIAIRTPGSGYSVLPCSPAPTFGGHGCGLKVTATFVGGVMTVAIIADMGGPCHVPAKRWWQITEMNIFAPGAAPPSTPRATVCGKMLNPFEKCWDALFDFCTGDTTRPVTRLWLPTGTDVVGSCCAIAGDVMEIPAQSGRLYDVLYVEYLDLDERCRCVGPCCCAGERLLAVLKQQCPLSPVAPIPPGDYIAAEDGVTPLLADPSHWITPD